MSTDDPRLCILGGGLAGNLLAICLARRGFSVQVLERRQQYENSVSSGGRSINLALASRGIAALEKFEAFDAIEPLLIPMAGRMLHEVGKPPAFVPYGQSSQECIYSVSRSELNFQLYKIATEVYGVRFRFDCECTGIESDSLYPILRFGNATELLPSKTVFATDGAGSAIRRSLEGMGAVESSETFLDHGYKELTIAARAKGTFALDPGALHIWPRGEFMLIALANKDGSFTVTLFLPMTGTTSFQSLNEASIEAFFAAQFPDALPLFEDLQGQFTANPTGILGTVRCAPWSHSGRYLLMGDAAHAIVPFHGQGMNAAFEDVLVLDQLLDKQLDWAATFHAFEQARLNNTEAIADMAIENYLEMRDTVRDPKFLLQRELALELERRYPNQFIPRYSMVMFHPEIPYCEAQTRGARQKQLLIELTQDAQRISDVDFDAADALIASLSSSS